MAKTIVLRRNKSVILKPKAPYNFDATVFKPSHYSDALKTYETGRYWFVMRLKNKVYGIKMENIGTISKPSLRVTLFFQSVVSNDDIRNIIDELDFRFEFSRDISGFHNRFKKDKVLAPFLKRRYGMHNSCAQDLYGLLMIGIFLQNTVVKRTVQMTEAMLKRYGTKVTFDGKEVFVFWKPKEMAKVSEEEVTSSPH